MYQERVDEGIFTVFSIIGASSDSSMLQTTSDLVNSSAA